MMGKKVNIFVVWFLIVFIWVLIFNLLMKVVLMVNIVFVFNFDVVIMY